MKLNGQVTAYDARQGRGVVTLANGATRAFKWDEVCYSGANRGAFLRHGRGNSPIGDGRCVKMGDEVEFDPNDVHTPVCITAGA